jgi:flagellar motor switch protein FliG
MPEQPQQYTGAGISSGASDTLKMSRTQRLAAFLLIIGPDAAAEIMRYMDQPDVEKVAMEMTRLPLLSQESQKEILKEFSNLAVKLLLVCMEAFKLRK